MDKDIAARLQQRWSSGSETSEQKWEDLRREANQERAKMRKEKGKDQEVDFDDVVRIRPHGFCLSTHLKDV